MLKKSIIAVLCLCMCSMAKAQSPVAGEKAALIPYPASLTMAQAKGFVMNENTVICADEALAAEAECLRERMAARFGVSLNRTGQQVKKGIRLLTDASLNDNPEHYTISIAKDGITIAGATAQAVFDAIQTLDQWCITNARQEAGAVSINAMQVEDSPRFGYRALMLDPARHFLPVKDVKRFIDEMVRYKFNVLQMHLTDDQGWRIAIKGHPELTASCEHYSAEDIKDLLAYAHERHVEIVPEVDIPGHTFGLLKNHRELCCDVVDTSDFDVKEHTDVMLCAAQDEVYPLMKDVLAELCRLFPSPYIHLGGDESLIEKNWGRCSRCQALKEKLGYDTNDQLMGYFFNHFWELLRQNGKKPILWIEMDNIWPPVTRCLFDYPKDVTLVTWRNRLTPKAIEFSAKGGNNLIMAPGEHCYFDYPQYKNDLPETNNWGMPILTLEQAYSWNPLYPELNLPTGHIQGVMGTFWGEAINDVNRAFYMAYPRSMALSESGWRTDKAADKEAFSDFLLRLKPVLGDMIGRGIPFRVPFEAYGTK